MFEPHVKTALLAHEPLADIIGTRVRPIVGMQNEVMPFVAYAVDDGEDVSRTNDGPSDVELNTFDLVSIAETYPDCARVAGLVKAAVKNYAGTVDGTQVFYIKFDSMSDIEQQVEEGTERPIYVRTVTLKALYR